MISIVIPLYNKQEYINNTLTMILNQTYQDFEIIVIDDGSTDNGAHIVKNFSDERIKFFSKKNGGVSSARNLGIEKSSFDYIAFLDADDIWLSNHLEEISNLIINYGDCSDVFVTNFSRKYIDGKLIVNRFDIEKGIINDYFAKVLFKDIIHTSCVCVSKIALLDIEGFDERLSRGEDLDVWLKLNRKYKTAYSPLVTEYYLQDTINNSRKKFPISSSIVYYFEKKIIKSKNEKKYIQKLILGKFFSLIFKERRIIDAFKLLWIKKEIFI